MLNFAHSPGFTWLGLCHLVTIKTRSSAVTADILYYLEILLWIKKPEEVAELSLFGVVAQLAESEKRLPLQ